MQPLDCSLLGWWVHMFMCLWHCWKYAWYVHLPLQACPNVILEDSLPYSSHYVDRVVFFMQLDSQRTISLNVLQAFDVHIFYPLYETSTLWVCSETEPFSLLTNSMQSGIWHCLLWSFSWFKTMMWSVVEYLLLSPACSRGWVSSSVFSSRFVNTFVSILQMFDCRHIGL